MANDGFIEFLSPNALKELEDAKIIVDALALQIEQINRFKAPKTPGGVNSASKQIIDDLKAQEQAIKKVSDIQRQIETNAKNQTSANQKLTKSEYDYVKSVERGIVAKERATKAAERSALANQRLNDAYGKLNRSRNEAARTLQNLIASETASNREIKKAQREFDILNAKVKKADEAVGNFSKNVGNYKSALSGVSQLMSAFGVSTGIFLAVDIAKSIFNTTKELQSLDMALRNVSGTQLIYQENMNFLSKVSEDFGIEIKGLQEQFTQFYVAAKDKLSADQIRDIFKSISKAGAAMGLSVDAQNSAFLALQQMMSKGTVQAEELKKQLGNALPGAFNIMATALGVTEKKMMEMMKAGNILSEVALPKFAKALEKAYGIENVERIDTIIAAQERLSNSWTNLIRTTTEGNGFIVNILIKTLDLWTLSLNGVIYATNVLSQATKNLFGIEDNNTTKKAKAVKQAISDYEEMQSALKKANEERDKELFRLNRLEKIEEKLTGSAKTRAQEAIVLSKEKLKLLDANIEKENKLLDIDKVDTVKKLNDEIVALKARNAEVSFFSLQAIEKRDKLVPQSEGWLDLNKYIKDNNKIVEENTTKLKYNETLRELILRKELDKSKQEKELDTDGETAKKIAAQKKAAKEKAQADEKLLKDKYDLEVSNAKRLIEITKDDFEIVEALNKDELDYFENGAKRKYELSLKLAKLELALAQMVATEKKRIAKGNVALGVAPTVGGDIIAQNEYYTEAENIAENHVGRLDKINKDFFKAMGEDIPKDIFGDMYKMTDEQKEALKEHEEKVKNLAELQKKLIDEFRNYIQSFAQEFASNSGFSETFDFFFRMDEDGKTMFDKLDGLADGSVEKFQATFLAISESAQEAFNFIAQLSAKNYDEEYARLEKEKDVAIAFAGENVAAQEEVQKQYEEKKRQIANKEAQDKKKIALFNIAIDTAQAIVASFKVDPTGLLAVGIGILGALQAAAVQSQEVPQFFKGTDNAPEGLAWTQEKGREIITDKSGKIKSTGSDKGAQLTYLSKGDKVFTAEKSALMFNDSLNSILTNNGISSAKVEVNNTGISDEQINRIVSSINNKESVQIYNDGTNIITKRKRANELVEIANKRINFVSKSV
jgi:tape measure domain-containing protein